MAIFLMLFALAVSFVYAWYQNSVSYIDTLHQQSYLDEAQISQNIVVTATNNASLTITNPTSTACSITQIWSNDSEIWSGFQVVAPYSSYTFSGTGTTSPANGWNSTALTLSNGNFEVVTSLGNLYSGSLSSQFSISTLKDWDVSWLNTTGVPQTGPTSPSAFASLTTTGTSYWNDLSFYWENITSSPVAFTANITVWKISPIGSNATINYYLDQNSEIQFSIDGVLQPSPANNQFYNWTHFAYFTLTGGQYTQHNITVYYYGFGGSQQDHFLKLNIVNATFLP